MQATLRNSGFENRRFVCLWDFVMVDFGSGHLRALKPSFRVHSRRCETEANVDTRQAVANLHIHKVSTRDRK
jgi:hypothetical protein